MKKRIFTLALLSSCIVSIAQKNANNKLQPLTKLNLELQGFGLSYEPGLGKSSTVDLSAGIGTGGYDIWSDSFTYIVDPLSPTVFISITPKFYYNRNKRSEKGKMEALNSGNYFGLRLKYTSAGLGENSSVADALLFNIHWGLQRAIAKRWTINSHVGIGFAMDATDLNHADGALYPALDLKFSYVLSKQRS